MAGIRIRYDQGQRTFCTTQRYIHLALGVGSCGELLLVAGHDQHVVVFEALGFVNAAQNPLRWCRPRIRAFAHDFSEGFIRTYKLADPDSVLEFGMKINLDGIEARLFSFNKGRIRSSAAATPVCDGSAISFRDMA